MALIAIYGGSYNPPTDEHLAIARNVRNILRADEVWLVVSPQNPLKESAGMLPFHHRLAMTRLLVEGESGLIVSDFENHLTTRQTSLMLRELFKAYPQHRFVWVMGADNMAALHTWHDWHSIMDTTPMLVLPRPGYNDAARASPAAHYSSAPRLDAAADLASQNGWHMLPGEGHETSATAERLALREGREPQHLTQAIRTYIVQHHLTL